MSTSVLFLADQQSLDYIQLYIKYLVFMRYGLNSLQSYPSIQATWFWLKL